MDNLSERIRQEKEKQADREFTTSMADLIKKEQEKLKSPAQPTMRPFEASDIRPPLSTWERAAQYGKQGFHSMVTEPYDDVKTILTGRGDKSPQQAAGQILGMGALSLIPVEAVAGFVGRPLVRFAGKMVQPIIASTTRTILGPLEHWMSSKIWGPAQTGLNKVFGRSEGLDSLSKDSINEANTYIKKWRGAASHDDRKILDPLFDKAIKTPYDVPKPIGVPGIASLDELQITNPTPLEHSVHIAADSLVKGFRDVFNLGRTENMSSFEQVIRVMADKENASQGLRSSAMRMFQKFGKNDKAIWEAIENPQTLAALKPELQRIPKILDSMMNNMWNTEKNAGLDVGFLSDYIPHYYKNFTQIFGDKSSDVAAKFSQKVISSKPRGIYQTKEALREIVQGKNWQKYGIDEETGRKLSLLKPSDSPAEDFASYIGSFARSERTKSLQTVLQSVSASGDFPMMTGAMSTADHELLDKTLFKAWQDASDIGNDKAKTALHTMRLELGSYKDLTLSGFSSGMKFNPKFAKDLEQLNSHPGKYAGVISSVLRWAQVSKGLQLSTSFFHIGNFSRIMTASGMGLEQLNATNALKQLGTREGQALLTELRTAGGNLFGDKELMYRMLREVDTQGTKMGTPDKLLELIQRNPMSKLTFEKVGLAFQVQLYQHHKADLIRRIADKTLPTMTSEQINRASAFMMNIKMGSLRPELMSFQARELGRTYFLARNWTLSNVYLGLNGLQEFILRNPLSKAILPPALTRLGPNMLQSFKGLSTIEQDVIRKELAKFTATSVMMNQWRLQLANLMTVGKLSFQNPQGHEFDVDSGQMEIGVTPKGRPSAREKYDNFNGWNNDLYKLIPVTLHIPPSIDPANARALLKGMKIEHDISKTLTMADNKANAIVHLYTDTRYAMLQAKQKGMPEPWLDAIKQTAPKVVMPMPLATALAHYKKTGNINDLYFYLALGVSGVVQQTTGQEITREAKQEINRR